VNAKHERTWFNDRLANDVTSAIAQSYICEWHCCKTHVATLKIPIMRPKKPREENDQDRYQEQKDEKDRKWGKTARQSRNQPRLAEMNIRRKAISTRALRTETRSRNRNDISTGKNSGTKDGA